MTFNPEPGIADDTLRATERWSAATGCDVRIAPGGLKVVQVDDLTTSSGKVAAGACRHREGERCSRIEIHRTYGGPNTIVHEMGHALGADGHSLTGMMAEGAPSGIDDASLELVCASLACAAFASESSHESP